MADQQPPAANGTEVVPAAPQLHPIAPRVKDGPKTPHIGPHIHAYRKAHSETVGHESDKWWAKVSPRCLVRVRIAYRLTGDPSSFHLLITGRWPGRPFTGIVPSTPSVRAVSRPATSSGSQKVVSMLLTIASTAGHSSIPIRWGCRIPSVIDLA